MGARSPRGRAFAGVMVLALRIPLAQSLKDKRQPLRSVKQRMRNAGLAVSEVDGHDAWQRATLALATTAQSQADAERRLDTALEICDARPELEVSVLQRTVLATDELDG